MVKDEICNTYIPEDEALKEVRNGQAHYFCSEECRKKFLSSKNKAG
ncbi:MAG: YHS domain-containing protein [Candidatus Aminicenantes bacterium]|nr:YHS domain-containing protein [Candidatus Aminicenantes bacterium]